MKKWIGILMALCLLLIPLSVLASEAIGRLEIRLLLPDGKPLVGVETELIPVASATVDGSTISYQRLDHFEGFGFNPEDLHDGTARSLADWIEDHELSGQTQSTDDSGTVIFEDLPDGMYLCKQKNTDLDSPAFIPFLVSIPAVTDQGLQYSWVASPKIESVPSSQSLTIRKVWNDDGKDRPDSIQVQIYIDNQPERIISLSQNEDWKVEIHDLPSGKVSAQEIQEKRKCECTITQTDHELILTNTPTLINTGQLNWPIPLLALMGLILAALGWLILRKASHE